MAPAQAVPFTKPTQAAILSPLTAQTATYNVFYGSFELGTAKYKLPATTSNYYVYQFDSDVGLLMLSDQRHIKSEFTLEGTKLVPYRYVQKRTGTGSDYEEQTAFLKSENYIHTIYKNDTKKLDYTEELFDPLMVQLQFRMDLAANHRPLSFKMVKEMDIDDYSFRVLGNEKVTLDSGTYDTVKIEVIRDSTKRQTIFWMAPKLAYLPVRLSHFSKGSKQLDIQLANYHFEKPLPIMTPAIIDGHDPEQAKQAQELIEQQNNGDISSSELDEIKRLATEK
ncbi:DUF3108 domain-containing protein [Shewanella intestini]|uniref:DUF3108 domain-containing protein n=2 Tax=Shewanellaceae TaxID=267890 RepID=A0ABS5I1N6_9GAMM|nr:DUF3108 domain-containing protein [Shewanella intestini]MRG36052.1 DUF3108 domain-containing protein [Shewanella sp. XMDDZSB0408]